MNNSFKHDASTSHAETVIRLKGPPQSSHNPVNGLRGQPSNCVHIWTVPTTIKRRVTIPARMACAWSPHAAAVCQTLEQQSREVLAWLQATTYKHSEKGEAVAQHVDSRQGENRKMASCFTFLKRITRLKIVNSEIKSRIHSPTWQGIPRRVQATVTNLAWITHLLRTTIANSDVERILRAKALQLYLTGMGRWKDLRKYRKVSIAIAIARCSKLEAATSLQLSQTVPNPDRLRKPYRHWSDIKWKSESLSLVWNCLKKRHAGYRLSRLPLTRNEHWRRYADWRPNLYHQIKWASSLVAVPNDLPLPPAMTVK